MRVAKWGNSLAVRFPKALVKALGLKAGDEVELSPLPAGKSASGKSTPPPNSSPTWRSSTCRPEGYRFDRDEANER